MQKKGGTKALFGSPNRSNRSFAFFVRIDKDFFAFCFAVFIVLCARPILRLSSMFLFCRFSFFSAKSIALFVARRFFAVLPPLFCCFTPVFPLHCRCFSPSNPFFPAGQTSFPSCVALLFLPHRSGTSHLFFHSLPFRSFSPVRKFPQKTKTERT